MPDPGAWKKNLGGALLSRGRLPQYPRHWGPSLPCSEWERVLPPRHGHQGKENGRRDPSCGVALGPRRDNRAGNMAPKRSKEKKAQASRTISTGRVNALPRLRLRPIEVVVFHRP